MSKKTRKLLILFALVAVVTTVATPSLLGQVGPCWQCYKLIFPPEIGGFHAMCWDYGDNQGSPNCMVLGGNQCVRWGGTCQNGV